MTTLLHPPFTELLTKVRTRKLVTLTSATNFSIIAASTQPVGHRVCSARKARPEEWLGLPGQEKVVLTTLLIARVDGNRMLRMAS